MDGTADTSERVRQCRSWDKRRRLRRASDALRDRPRMNNLPYFLVRNRRMVLLAWVIAAAALIPFARGAEKRLETGTQVPGSESARVSELLATTLRSPFAHYAALVVRGVAADSSRNVVLRRIEARLKSNRVVTAVRSSLDTPDTLFTGKDGAPV